ncbi:hypothetical protein [Microbacterium murale]|uniref:Siderophore-interacting protein n=1 Tax=Microbacterium murale TaxID=1081040 RepID=A0ABU0P7Y7_9MICO|nr:hypothetical protein [Microbacterium murale]MDQ0643453.1 hypothetical protein [Microbacterium murale]
MIRRQYPAWIRRRRRGAPDLATMEELARAMVFADEGAIRAVLHPEVILTIDSGGLVPAAPTPVGGHAAVASSLVVLMTPETSVTMASINSVPGFTLIREETVVGAVTADTRSGQLSSVWVVCNPEKLRHWNRR